MNAVLYEASVPVFLRYLERLGGLVDAAEACAAQGGRAADDVLAARLAPDMLPFATQVEIAANFGLRACFPLAGLPVPPYGEFAPGFDGLRARIGHVAGLLRALPPDRYAGAASRTLESRAGEALVSLPASEFLFQYALPNFLFHVTTAYAILRSLGVPLGKRDYDGFHAYRRTPGAIPRGDGRQCENTALPSGCAP